MYKIIKILSNIFSNRFTAKNKGKKSKKKKKIKTKIKNKTQKIAKTRKTKNKFCFIFLTLFCIWII